MGTVWLIIMYHCKLMTGPHILKMTKWTTKVCSNQKSDIFSMINKISYVKGNEYTLQPNVSRESTSSQMFVLIHALNILKCQHKYCILTSPIPLVWHHPISFSFLHNNKWAGSFTPSVIWACFSITVAMSCFLFSSSAVSVLNVMTEHRGETEIMPTTPSCIDLDLLIVWENRSVL